MDHPDERAAWTIRPIGVVRSPFTEKASAPRQATAEGARDTRGTLEIAPEHEHALADLEGFERIWVIFWFDRAEAARAKVLPPRSTKRRGVFATRSPHRPNPIGMSAVRLERIEGTTLHVRDLDILDGTPVIDLKPYLAYADAFPEARAGWLEATDPVPGYEVTFEPRAEARFAWVEREAPETGRLLRERTLAGLSLGPSPHPYRRIKRDAEGLVLAVKEWRVRFEVEGRAVRVLDLRTGYRPREIHGGTAPELALHRAFVAAFG